MGKASKIVKQEGWYNAVIKRETVRDDRVSVAVVTEPGDREGKSFPIDKTDAWNFDIYVGLPVFISFDEVRIPDGCRIERRLSNNKKFVCV